MKTSRVARETARVTTSFSPTDFTPRRQTRLFAASLQAFTSNGDDSLQKLGKNVLKHEEPENDESPLSSLGSRGDFDIEDLLLEVSSSRKRRRGIDGPSTVVATTSTYTSTRVSPRNAGAKTEDVAIKKVKRARRQPPKGIVNEAGEEEIQAPANWEEIYNAVKEMRRERLAPVDTMGCETLADERVTPRDKRFQTLIALMLSSQTKDTTNAIAMRRLQTELPSPGLTLENILAVDPIKLNELIYAVGFHNNKTRYIKAAALVLRDEYAGDIPGTIEGLMALPGVGPKMAYLCLSAAWGRTEGIGVDVHVHRITNLWGWHNTKTPEETRVQLETWLPRDRWHEINHLLVGFGQTICIPVGRKCGECVLSQRSLCPAAVTDKKGVAKRVKKEVVKGNGLEVRNVENDMVDKEENLLAEDTRTE